MIESGPFLQAQGLGSASRANPSLSQCCLNLIVGESQSGCERVVQLFAALGKTGTDDAKEAFGVPHGEGKIGPIRANWMAINADYR